MRRVLIIAVALLLVGVGGVILYRERLGATSAATSTTTTAVAAAATTTTAAPTTSAAPAPTTTAAPTTTTTLPPEPMVIPAAAPAGPEAPAPASPEGWDGVGVITVAAGGADLASQPGGDPFHRLREGVILAGKGLSSDGEWVRIFHMCDGAAWVRLAEIAAEDPAEPALVGEGFDFADAVIVVDPGHGGPSNIGAVSPGGLAEKTLNVEVSARVAALLREPHAIDWETGEILVGADVPAARQVVITRVGEGVAADYEAGLDFRSAVANAANAHAMVSIHHNAGWEVELDVPGSDVYYQSQAPIYDESRRLATILVEELRRGFATFEADWVGAIELGAKSRLSPRDGVSQYYGILKSSAVPTVIAEGAYVSNPSEAALLETPEFQHAYAAAVYRTLVRFLTTDDPGNGPSHDPEVWEGFAGSGAARQTCELPAQES